MNEFGDKVVLVTGGTRGIGRACAQTFADAGAAVALCGRSKDKAKEVAKEIGGKSRGYQADMSNPDDIEALFKAVSDEFGPVSVLVNNAGITRDTLLMRMKDEDWNSVIETNLSGVFQCCRAAIRGMLKLKYGRIINISSIIGLRGQAGQANYAAAKAGIIGFSKSLAQELGSRNVTVNVVAPGYIATDMTASLPEDKMEALVKQIPLQRVGTAADIAKAVRFLASDDAAYITGSVLQVDGGLAM